MGPILMVLGGIYFTTIYKIIFNTLRSLGQPKFPDARCSYIALKCVSSLQAVTACIAGAVIVYNCRGNIMYDTHWLTKGYAWFGVLYYYYDTWAMCDAYIYANIETLRDFTRWEKFIHFVIRNKPMMVHHMLLPVIFFPFIIWLRSDKGDFFIGLFYMIEFTIPFVSLRDIMVHVAQHTCNSMLASVTTFLKLKETAMYVPVGLMMVISFFISRILVFPYMYWHYSQFADIDFIHVPFRIPIYCNLGCLCLLVLQIYWFILMARGAFRVFYKLYARKCNGQLKPS